MANQAPNNPPQQTQGQTLLDFMRYLHSLLAQRDPEMNEQVIDMLGQSIVDAENALAAESALSPLQKAMWQASGKKIIKPGEA